jgi:pimeloyl-ACP methyl ester carboxylesterase
MMWLALRSRVGTRAMRRSGFLQLVMTPEERASEETAALVEKLPDLFGHDLADQPAIVNEQLRAMRDTDLSARLARLALLPTLILCAAQDPIAPISAGREIAHGIPGSRLVEFEGASHGLPMTHAGSVNGMLRDHFERAEKLWP